MPAGEGPREAAYSSEVIPAVGDIVLVDWRQSDGTPTLQTPRLLVKGREIVYYGVGAAHRIEVYLTCEEAK